MQEARSASILASSLGTGAAGMMGAGVTPHPKVVTPGVGLDTCTSVADATRFVGLSQLSSCNRKTSSHLPQAVTLLTYTPLS
jgi:hypothetical protein